nr:hypothetical protein [Tanacetum cinerariifolium]
MMVCLKNMVGFKMDYFKGMSYDDIRIIFKKHFNSNVAFLEKNKEQFEEKESRALKRQSESSEQQAAKKQKLDEEVEELKKHLQIIPNDEDDVYTESTPLARKVYVVDYEIFTENNKPYYKIVRADESNMRSWISKGQKLKIVRVLWSAYHNIYNYTDDLASRKMISIDKICKATTARRIQTRVEFGYILHKDQCKLMLLDNAVDSRLRLLEQSAAVVQIVSVVQIVKIVSIRVNTIMYKLRLFVSAA